MHLGSFLLCLFPYFLIEIDIPTFIDKPLRKKTQPGEPRFKDSEPCVSSTFKSRAPSVILHCPSLRALTVSHQPFGAPRWLPRSPLSATEGLVPELPSCRGARSCAVLAVFEPLANQVSLIRDNAISEMRPSNVFLSSVFGILLHACSAAALRFTDESTSPAIDMMAEAGAG